MLEQAFTFAFLMLLFRSVPFVGYALVSERFTAPAKLGAGLALLAFAGILELSGAPALNAIGRAVLVGLGFLAVAIAAHLALARVRLGAAATLVSVVAAFLVLPCAVAPEALRVEVATLGFEMSLSAHSFLRSAGAHRPSPWKFLEFVLVNPVLVFPDPVRNAAEPGLHPAGLGRVGLGVTAVVAQSVISWWMQMLRPATPVVVGLVAYDLTLYFAHSGLASLQIGLALVIGIRVGERYRYPFLATSPADFWRRWNRWLGHWARRYAYEPARRVLGRHMGRRRAAGLAIVGTFTSIGLLHDVARLVARWRAPVSAIDALGVTGAFLAFGLEVVLWSAAAQAWRAAHASSPRRRAAGSAFGWCLCTGLHLVHGAVAWRVLAW